MEYVDRDLRMRNDLPAPLAIRAGVGDGRAFAEAWSTPDVRLEVLVDAGPAQRTERGSRGAIEVRTRRTVSFNGSTWTDDLGLSRPESPRD